MSHGHGRLVARIALRNDRGSVIFPYLFLIVVALLYCSVFIKPFLRGFRPEAALFLSLFGGLGGVALIAILVALFWAEFGREEIVVENDVMRWTRKALWWVRRAEILTREISEVEAVTDWFSSENHVEFVASGRRYKIGSKLLRDEAIQLAHALSYAAGLQRRAHRAT